MGYFEYNDWNFDYNTLPYFKEGSIKILHRDHIKVYYDKVSDAEKDGYTNFNPDDYPNKNRHLYSFTGIRGDAKILYEEIKKG